MESSLLSAIIGHVAGDYLLQNDWMALNKKTRLLPCVAHCTVWATSVCLFSGQMHVLLWLLLFFSHFVQDHTNIVAWYMRKVGQETFLTGACAPWSAIVVDNVFHVVTLWILWKPSVFAHISG